jgi:hypothetical protein
MTRILLRVRGQVNAGKVLAAGRFDWFSLALAAKA